jgi:Putative ATPase subunit of terminase (gpP-like)
MNNKKQHKSPPKGKAKATAKQNTKPPVDREAIRVLAIELGAREAARRLGIKESTVLSWARRYNWKLPKRKGGGLNAITPQSKPGDALIASHKELEGRTRSALATAIAKAAEAVASQEALPVASVAALKDLVLAGAKHFGWEVNQTPSVSVQGEKVAVVFNEELRKKLIEQRRQILEEQSRTAPKILAQPQTKLQRDAGDAAPVANGEEKNAAPTGDDKSAVTPPQPDPVYLRMQSIGRAESWRENQR